jgi:hypothetical protein
MRRTDSLSAPAWVDLVRNAVAYVGENQRCGESTTYRELAVRFHLTHAEVDDIIADSDAYGPQLVLRAGVYARPVGETIVEIETP